MGCRSIKDAFVARSVLLLHGISSRSVSTRVLGKSA